MCQLGGPSIAAFLQQAEENLALLGARADCSPWAPQRLRSGAPLSARGGGSLRAAGAASPSELSESCASEGVSRRSGGPLVQRSAVAGDGSTVARYAALDARTRSSGSRQQVAVEVEPAATDPSSTRSGGSGSVTPRRQRPRVAGGLSAAAAAAKEFAALGSGASRHHEEDFEESDDAPKAALHPRELESWARRLDGSRAAVDNALRLAEDRQAEAKEQMDVQAKTLLGLDRKVRGYDARIRAVEAAVAAVSDIAAGAAKSASNKLPRATSPSAGAEDCSTETEAEAEPKRGGRGGRTRSRSRGVSPGLTPRQQVQQQQSIAELQRRVGALSDAARKDRETAKQSARRIADSHAEEIKRNLEQRLETFDSELREREQRQLERLQQEVQRHAEKLGRDLAGELLRGPVSDLVDRRARDSEQLWRQALLDVERELTQRLRHVEQAQHAEAERMEQLVQERVMSVIAVEGGLCDNISSRMVGIGDGVGNAASDERGAGANATDLGRRLRGASAMPGGLLRRTVECVAELQARAHNEERTYWETVQALELRVGGLEDAFSCAQEDAEKEKVFVRKRLVVLEKEAQEFRKGKACVVQDPAAQKKPPFGASPRTPVRGAFGMDLGSQQARNFDALYGREDVDGQYGPEPGLLITPRRNGAVPVSSFARRPSVTQHTRGHSAATARHRQQQQLAAEEESQDELTFDERESPRKHETFGFAASSESPKGESDHAEAFEEEQVRSSSKASSRRDSVPHVCSAGGHDAEIASPDIDQGSFGSRGSGAGNVVTAETKSPGDVDGDALEEFTQNPSDGHDAIGSASGGGAKPLEDEVGSCAQGDARMSSGLRQQQHDPDGSERASEPSRNGNARGSERVSLDEGEALKTGSRRRPSWEIAEQPTPPKPSAAFVWPVEAKPRSPEVELPETEAEAAETRAARAWLAENNGHAGVVSSTSSGRRWNAPAEEDGVRHVGADSQRRELPSQPSQASQQHPVVSPLPTPAPLPRLAEPPMQPAPTLEQRPPATSSGSHQEPRRKRSTEGPELWDEILAELGDEVASAVSSAPALDAFISPGAHGSRQGNSLTSIPRPRGVPSDVGSASDFRSDDDLPI